MSIANIIYKYVVKGLAKNEGGIPQLPTTQQITQAMEDIFQRLRDGGLNPVSAKKLIQNEDDLKRTLSEIDQAEIMEIKRRQDAAEGIETVLDKMNRGIPLNPGDQAKIEGAGMKTTLDAFRGFEPKVIQGGKGKKGIEELIEEGVVTKGIAPKTSRETIKRKSMIDPKLTEEENIKNIMKENKASAKRLESKMNKEKDLGDKLKDFDGDPDAMADGGLATMFRKK